MIGQKALMGLPWEVRYPKRSREGKGRGSNEIELHACIIEHEGRRLLKVELWDIANHYYLAQRLEKFRVFADPERKEYFVEKGGSAVYGDISDYICEFCNYSTTYSRGVLIGKADTERLMAFTGCEASGNGFLLEFANLLQDWREIRTRSGKRDRGGIPDETVFLCGDALPEDLEEIVHKRILFKEKQIFYKKGGISARCHHCGSSFQSRVKLTLYSTYTCPWCQTKCLCQNENGNRWSVDYVDNIFIFQKGTDGETVFARQFHVGRDMTCKYDNWPQYLTEIARYAFRDGKAAVWQMYYKAQYGMCRRQEYKNSDWERRGSWGLYDNGGAVIFDGAAEAFAGTKLQYCELGAFTDGSFINYLAHFCRYPCVEYLWKKGYRNLVAEKCNGLGKDSRYLVNWQAKDRKAVFKLDRGLLADIPPESLSHSDMLTIKQFVDAGVTDKKHIKAMAAAGFNTDIIKRLGAEGIDGKLLYDAARYMTRQMTENENVHGKDYFDYIRELKKLEYALTPEVLFPPDFMAAHNRASEAVSYKESPEKWEKMAAAAEGLSAFDWHNKAMGLIIRAARTPGELTAEGRTLNHCVGGYAGGVANGDYGIFFIRQWDKPESSCYTLQLRGETVVQCRGKNNCGMTSEVQAFVDKWLAYVKRKQKEKRPSSEGKKTEGAA